MDHRCITFERREAVGLLTLNRPERANAIDRTMLAELNAAAMRSRPTRRSARWS